MGEVERLIVIALLSVIGVLVYRWHIGRHPWMPCLACNGGGKSRALSLNPYGPCGRCGGTGRRRRFAAWILRYNRETGARR